jgi:protein-S-isoprenylcysteine O-methyltransferase Ste14
VLLLFKNLAFTLIVPGTVAIYVPWLIARGLPAASLGHVLASAPLFLLGGTIYLWCVWDFATLGKGTPAPIDPPKRLIVRGLYRFTRNPMYIGVLIAITGWEVLIQAAELGLYALVVGVMFHLFVVLYEEPRLHALFGMDYENYCARVRRWLPSPPFNPVREADPTGGADAQPSEAASRSDEGSRRPHRSR